MCELSLLRMTQHRELASYRSWLPGLVKAPTNKWASCCIYYGYVCVYTCMYIQAEGRKHENLEGFSIWKAVDLYCRYLCNLGQVLTFPFSNMTIGIPTTALSTLRSCCALTNVRAPCRQKARYQGEGRVLQEVCSHKAKETPATRWDYVGPLLSNKYILSSYFYPFISIQFLKEVL